MADVFISYRRDDRPKAEALYKALKDEGLDIWWDGGLQAGETFDEKIQSLLQSVKAVVVLWSPAAVESEWVRGEGTIGRERGVLVPVMVKPVTIPVPFNLIHTADLSHWSGDRSDPTYQGVVARIKLLASKQNVKPLKPPPNRALRALWRAIAAVAMIAAAGASLWIFQPWNAVIAATDPALQTKKARDASLARLADFGVQPADIETRTGRRIARHIFNPATRDQLNAEAAKGNPALLALKCAVDFWATKDGTPDWEGARSACERAAAAGEPAAQVYYGQLLEETAAYTDGDDQRAGLRASAVAEFKKAADKGFGWGEIIYGWRLREDRGGAPADPAAAETLFKSAQQKGMPAADCALARLYLSAEVASPVGPEEAFAEVRKAADAGDAGCQFFAAERLVGGGDFEEDLEAALAYYIAAAAADDGEDSWKAARLISDTEARLARKRAETASAPPSPS